MFSPEQRVEIDAIFSEKNYLNHEEAMAIAEKYGLTKAQIMRFWCKERHRKGIKADQFKSSGGPKHKWAGPGKSSVFTDENLVEMHELFKTNNYLEGTMAVDLAEKYQCKVKQIHNWWGQQRRVNNLQDPNRIAPSRSTPMPEETTEILKCRIFENY